MPCGCRVCAQSVRRNEPGTPPWWGGVFWGVIKVSNLFIFLVRKNKEINKKIYFFKAPD